MLTAYHISKSYGTTPILQSHDRTFLDRTVQRILDLNPESYTIRSYAGNCTGYLEQYWPESQTVEGI